MELAGGKGNGSNGNGKGFKGALEAAEGGDRPWNPGA
jgi:hypothetical protein